MSSQTASTLAFDSRLFAVFKPFSDGIRRHPRLFTLASLLGLSSPWLRNNYREFKALGPGGLPYNVCGWLIALAFKPFGRETTSTDEYDRDLNKASWISEEERERFPERRGSRPNSGFHVVPARQFNKIPKQEMMKRLDALVDRLLKENSHLVVAGRSPNERLHNGVLIHPDIPTPHGPAKASKREILHIHPSDHSLHVVLAPQDCKLVIERNWGERHKLSGAKILGLPKEYIWIYAPRDEEELEVVEKILTASIGFMTGSGNVKH
ncbi:hypothetical protein EW026_g4158 [Hermanssonia centrifuga]|uniref:Luciferase domain-containing protein n=1 Tax=Hermanssonia centrifuga TaxID=98765 RepID=A0A4S4KJ13_9APHY|nr:hypothetical protein EW026_g4158 [Hermanssonia centrifuga]